MDYTKQNADGTGTKIFTEDNISLAPSKIVVTVASVEELEDAIAAQTAGQWIEVLSGDYELTESASILLAANGGGIRGIGTVSITGADTADEAILIDPAVATSTFEYSFENLSIHGGSAKIGLNVANTATAKKIIVYLNQCSIEEHGSGTALKVTNTDGSNAIRIYMNGPGEIEDIDFTPLDDGDRLIISNMNVEENVVVAVVDCTATFMFKNCKLPHEGITGGHANNVCSSAYCWTEAVAFVPVAVDAGDFPGAFSATILGA